MAAKLDELGLKRTPQQVGTFAKRFIAPTLSKVSAKAELKLGSIEEAMDKVLSLLQTIESTDAADWTPGMTFKLKALGEWFDRFARLRGLYPKEGGMAVAVQVNVQEAKEKLWAILSDKPS